jgi:hypothetical protein
VIHGFNLIAFLAVLGSIVWLALAGEGTDLAIMTGLVGILGTFRPWSSMTGGPSGTKGDPVAVEGAEEGSKPVNTTDTPGG